jgi:hypothetical protein
MITRRTFEQAGASGSPAAILPARPRYKVGPQIDLVSAAIGGFQRSGPLSPTCADVRCQAWTHSRRAERLQIAHPEGPAPEYGRRA